MPDFLGIIAGHAWYFATTLYPAHAGCRTLVPTPKFARALADYINSGSGAVHAASNAVQPPHTRYFAGRGRRLGVIESDEEGRRRTNERTNERTNVAL